MSLVEARIPISVAAAEAVENALAEAENAEWGVFEDRPTASAWLGSYFPDAAAATAAAQRARRDLRGHGAREHADKGQERNEVGTHCGTLKRETTGI